MNYRQSGSIRINQGLQYGTHNIYWGFANLIYGYKLTSQNIQNGSFIGSLSIINFPSNIFPLFPCIYFGRPSNKLTFFGHFTWNVVRRLISNSL